MAKSSLMILPEFLKRLDGLPQKTKLKIPRILNTLSKDFKHPSLQSKKLKGNNKDVYECRVDQGIRLIYDIYKGYLRCWYIGGHDEALKFATTRKTSEKEVFVDDIQLGIFDKDVNDLVSFLSSGRLSDRFISVDLDTLRKKLKVSEENI